MVGLRGFAGLWGNCRFYEFLGFAGSGGFYRGEGELIVGKLGFVGFYGFVVCEVWWVFFAEVWWVFGWLEGRGRLLMDEKGWGDVMLYYIVVKGRGRLLMDEKGWGDVMLYYIVVKGDCRGVLWEGVGLCR
jgi:hypothetical protein